MYGLCRKRPKFYLEVKTVDFFRLKFTCGLNYFDNDLAIYRFIFLLADGESWRQTLIPC